MQGFSPSEDKKMFWKMVMRVRKRETGTNKVVRNANGCFLLESGDARMRWGEYM